MQGHSAPPAASTTHQVVAQQPRKAREGCVTTVFFPSDDTAIILVHGKWGFATTAQNQNQKIFSKFEN